MRESGAWRRQRLIAEGLLGDKQRRVLADVRARRFIDKIAPDVSVPTAVNEFESHAKREAPTPSAPLREISEDELQWADGIVGRFAALGAVELKLKYHGENPDERDEGGKFAPKGTGGGGTAEVTEKPVAAASRGPQVKAEKGVSKQTISRVNAAVAAIPAKHAELLKNVPVWITETNENLRSQDTIGFYNPRNKQIQIPEKARAVMTGFDGVERTYDTPLKDFEHAVLHELGHAYDDHTGSKVESEIKSELAQAQKRMTPEDRRKSTYVLGVRGEAFAELYTLAHNPARGGKYFGGLDRKTAEKYFREALAKVRSL